MGFGISPQTSATERSDRSPIIAGSTAVVGSAPVAQINQSAEAHPTVFRTLRIGAGGFIHDLDIQCDQGVRQCRGTGTTTKVVRTDTYGPICSILPSRIARTPPQVDAGSS